MVEPLLRILASFISYPTYEPGKHYLANIRYWTTGYTRTHIIQHYSLGRELKLRKSTNDCELRLSDNVEMTA
jgi:hypothetical protein